MTSRYQKWYTKSTFNDLRGKHLYMPKTWQFQKKGGAHVQVLDLRVAARSFAVLWWTVDLKHWGGKIFRQVLQEVRDVRLPKLGTKINWTIAGSKQAEHLMKGFIALTYQIITSNLLNNKNKQNKHVISNAHVPGAPLKQRHCLPKPTTCTNARRGNHQDTKSKIICWEMNRHCFPPWFVSCFFLAEHHPLIPPAWF